MHCMHGPPGDDRITWPPDHRPVLPVNVHADVDVVHQVTAASDLELTSAAVSINGADHYLAIAQRFWIVLPLARKSPDDGIRLKAQDFHLRDVQLGRLRARVARLGANEPVQV
jgi:hypothetical protein